jgi:hypothetical protein
VGHPAQSNPSTFGEGYGRDEMDLPWQYFARDHIPPGVLHDCDLISSMLQHIQDSIGILTGL